jgi:hypothetical protein
VQYDLYKFLCYIITQLNQIHRANLRVIYNAPVTITVNANNEPSSAPLWQQMPLHLYEWCTKRGLLAHLKYRKIDVFV